MHLCKELSCAVHRLTRAVQMYWLAHLASASLVPRLLVGARLGAQIALWLYAHSAALIQCGRCHVHFCGLL